MGLPALKLGMNAGTISLGAVVVLFGPAILTAAGGLAGSLLKSGIKGGIIAYEKGKVMIAEAKESVEDITAEAKAEISKPHKAVAAKKAYDSEEPLSKGPGPAEGPGPLLSWNRALRSSRSSAYPRLFRSPGVSP